VADRTRPGGVATALPLVLVRLHSNAIFSGPRVLTNAGHLPTHFDIRRAGANRKAIALDPFRDYRLRECSNHPELISEIRVESFEVVGQLNLPRLIGPS